jgi:hypothetical protein
MANKHRITYGLLILLFACEARTSSSPKTLGEAFDCRQGLMEHAWYEYGGDGPIPDKLTLGSGFKILVDTNLRPTNFISFEEEYLRGQSNDLDTNTYRNKDDAWEIMTPKQKMAKVSQERIACKQQADSVHLANNQHQNQVWIVNNTEDTVSVQMQDPSFICIMQALSKKGNWLPVQYWGFSGCGNSYHDKPFPPKTANSFVTHLPKNGDYETKLRFKLLGTDRFYYSNEFYGKINSCQFVEDTSASESRYGRRYHYTLDTMVHLSMF